MSDTALEPRTASPGASYDINRSQFPDHVIARAYALLEGGYSNLAIERMLKAEFNERTPSHETIRTWDRELAETCNEESRDRARRVISIADDCVVQGLTDLRAGENTLALKHLVSANIVAGTYRDKEFKHSEAGKAPVQVNVILSERYDLLRGRTEPLTIDVPAP